MLTFSTSALSTGTGAIQWGGGGVGVTDRSIGQFAGMNVVIDSQVNTSAPGASGHQKEFRCYLIKSGTILEGEQSPLSIESDRNILSKQDVMSVDYHSAYHIMGTKWSLLLTTQQTQQLDELKQLGCYIRCRLNSYS